MPPKIPVKTAAGHDEMRHRHRVPSQRHRTVLFLVDGRRTEDQVMALARQAGAPDECLQDLVDLGLVLIPEPAATLSPAVAPDVSAPSTQSGGDSIDAALMPALSLPPDSALTDWSPPTATTAESFSSFADLADADDPAIERARDTLVRAVRSEAPLAGSLTVMRLRRARTRAELLALLGEVEAHIRKPHRTLVPDQMLQQVRALLQGVVVRPPSPPRS